VATAIGADAVIYLPLRDLVECCMKERRNMDVKRFEVGMFTGEYVDRAHGVSMQPVTERTVAAITLGDDVSGVLSKIPGAIVEVR
jgi:glutamine phosphoribosylpyrophosphate amidotransferase